MNGRTFQDGGNLISEAEGGQVEILDKKGSSYLTFPDSS